MKNEDLAAGFTFILHVLLRDFSGFDRKGFADELRRQVEGAPESAQGMAKFVQTFAKNIEDLEHRTAWIPTVIDGNPDPDNSQ